MEKIDWGKYGIKATRFGWTADGVLVCAWSCNAFGARTVSKKHYKSDKGAIAACKRWIRKHGVKP